MGIRIGDLTNRFELMNWNEPVGDRTPRRFIDHAEALRFVRIHLLPDEVASAVRRWSHDLGISSGTHSVFLNRLAHAIMMGEVWVAELERGSLQGGGGGGGGGGKDDPPGPNPGPGPRPGPKPKPVPVAELVVTVKDLNGKPVEGVTVTAGALGSKTTDKNGVADYGKVTPGSYDITAAKPGHGKKRNGNEEKDEKKAVSVPDGSKTAVDLIQHPECANVAFFEGSKVRPNYFGFDHKTNMRAVPKPSYWDPIPPKGSLKMPTDRLTRDEARWVSVAVGQEAEVEIHFLFSDTPCVPCLANTTYEVIPATVAEVVTAQITTQHSWFKIKGKAEGEATLKVVCDGKEIGWFHIWCKEEATVNLDICMVTTTRARAAVYSATDIDTRLNRIYRQAALKVSTLDLGTIDLSASAGISTLESKIYPSDGKAPFKNFGSDLDNLLAGLEGAINGALATRATGPKPRDKTRKLIFYVPTLGCNLNGMARNIGFSSVFLFYDTSPGYFSTCGHELGHSLSLRHPSDPKGSSQYAEHNFKSAGQNPTPSWSATNTEPEVPTHAYVTADEIDESKNVQGNDPLNLMGYWHDRGKRNQLRYHQWKAMDRK